MNGSEFVTLVSVFSHPTWDLVVIFALLSAGFFYGIMAGKRRIAATIMYTYVAFALTSVLPLEKFSAAFDEAQAFFASLGVFFAIFLLLAFFLGSRRGAAGRAPASSWWQIFLLSFLQVGFLIHIFLGFLPSDKITALAPITKNVFANPDLRLWWFVAPIAIVLFLRRLEAREEQ